MKTKIGVLVIILAIGLGCAVNTNLGESGLSLRTKAVSEGIRLSFTNLPEDTARLWVSLFDATANDQILTYADIRGDALAELKKSGGLLCPFVQNGHEYDIFAYAWTKMENIDPEEHYRTNALAGGGIYMTNAPVLRFTGNNNGLALSEKPEFSKEVEYAQDNLYSWMMSVQVDDQHSYGCGDSSKELSADFSQMAGELSEKYGVSGDIPIFGSVNCNLRHGQYTWAVGIAKTEEVIVTF